MASIENRSRFLVTVKNREDLSQTFHYSAKQGLQAHLHQLKSQGFKPKLSRLDDVFAVRVRQIGYPDQCIFAGSDQEAVDIKLAIESERNRGIFTDYRLGWQTKFSDLLTRYLHEESPRHKNFEIEGYKINALLEDAGLPRQDLSEILAKHKSPHPKLASKRLGKPTGRRVSQPSEYVAFILKPFAALVPDDFSDYIDERCQAVAASTVDRELDLFSAVCRIAIDTWRIPIAKSPMEGVRRPRYFNERDRRLKPGELSRLLAAAHAEDQERSINLHREALMTRERQDSNAAQTNYRRKSIVKAARQMYTAQAEVGHAHIPLFETFIKFQMMTAARRCETLSLTWAQVDLEAQTAFLPDTKNGRSRKLSLRKDLVEMLRQLPKDDACLFPIGIDGLRNAWGRICDQAGFTEEHELRVHDLRHEAISLVAEAGSNTPGGFSLVDLQAFSGHRDTRMLLRYAHLCAQSLAKRLDAAFEDKSQSTTHRGRRRLGKSADISLADIVQATTLKQPGINYAVKLPSVTPTLLSWGR